VVQFHLIVAGLENYFAEQSREQNKQKQGKNNQKAIGNTQT
jgi:hypothetical protein